MHPQVAVSVPPLFVQAVVKVVLLHTHWPLALAVLPVGHELPQVVALTVPPLPVQAVVNAVVSHTH